MGYVGPHLGHERPDRSGTTTVTSGPSSAQLSNRTRPSVTGRHPLLGLSDTEVITPPGLTLGARVGCPSSGWRAAGSDCGREGHGSCAWAADGQQPGSVTTGEPVRKPWRTMTSDAAIDGYWPGVSHPSSPVLNTTQFLARRPSADLARRKSPGAGSALGPCRNGRQGNRRSPTVADGSEKSHVAGPAAHAAGTIQVGDSACGPTVEKGVRRPRSRKRAPMSPRPTGLY